MCYYPDGSQATNDTACTSSTNSTCCGNGYACLSNNICMATSADAQKPDATLYVRGSCTDQSFTSSNCPLFCLNGTYDDLGGGEGIALCPDSSTEFFCIDGRYEAGDVSCSGVIDVFEFPG